MQIKVITASIMQFLLKDGAAECTLTQMHSLLLFQPYPIETRKTKASRGKVYSLFKDTVTQNIASNDWMIINYELEKMLKEVVTGKFTVLSWHLPGGTEEKHNKPPDRIAGG
jgi:hypothetical protein